MEPFTEATYEQLGRLIKILDNPKSREGDNHISYDYFLEWADGKNVRAPWHSTEYVIDYWEKAIEGRS